MDAVCIFGHSPVSSCDDGVFRTPPVAVMRKSDWKVHLFFEEWMLDGGWEKRASNNSIELYNLAEDISEKNNLAGSQPEKRDAMIKDLQGWMKAIEAPVPSVPNPAYKGTVESLGKSARKQGRRPRKGGEQE